MNNIYNMANDIDGNDQHKDGETDKESESDEAVKTMYKLGTKHKVVQGD